MRNILIRSIAFFVIICSVTSKLSAQSCVPTNLNGTVISLSCGTPCTNLAFKVPHLKATTDYVINDVPFYEFPYDQGTALTSLYQDDEYSALLPMTFPMCFYGQTYNNIVVGSNGIVTFEALCANASNAYTLLVAGAPRPLPYAVGAGPTTIATTYYPRTAIMGAYHDIDPSGTQLPTRRIEYNVFGTAPCRKFVVSYRDVKMFSCTDQINTTQIVLYESTGLVDVIITKKPLCPAWNGGLAILGIQDETRTKFVAAPGKNCTQWEEAGTVYRFTPNGGASRFVSSELLDMSGTILGVADTTTTTAGLLDIAFPNAICPVGPSTKYVVRTTFGSCPAGTNMVSLDTITINRNTTLPVTSSVTATTCNQNTGTITVNLTPGVGTAPFQFSLNGGALQGSNVFTGLAAGPYVVYATDATGCDTSFTVNVPSSTNLTSTVVITPTSCPTASNGTVTITAQGTAPHNFTLTGPGGPYTQTSPVFTGLAAGFYNLTFTDANGCPGSLPGIVVTAGPATTGAAITTPASCPGVNNGTLTATSNAGAGTVYTLTPGAVSNTTGIFTGLGAGTYSVAYSSPAGCTGTINVNTTVTAGPAPTGTATATATTCPNVNDGSIRVTTPAGPGITYTVNPGNISNTTGIFTGLAAGTYTVTFVNAAGCNGTIIPNQVITTGPAVTGTAAATATSCPGINDGTVTVTSPAGTGNTYTLNPGNISNTTGLFTGLAPGTYTISFVTAAGCTGNVTVNPVVGTGPAPTAVVTTVNPLCAGINDGTVTIVPNGTPTTYTFTLNPGAVTNTTGVFTGLTAGVAYTYSFQSAAGCIGGGNFTLTTNTAIVVPATLTMPLCNGTATGIITFNPSGGVGPYQYSANGGTTFQASNTFTAQTAGSHTFRIRDAVGCIRDTTVILAQPTALVSSSVSTAPTGCGNTDGVIRVTASGATPAYSYTIAGPTVNTTGATTGIFTGLGTGTYTLTTTDAMGCTSVSNATVVLVDNMFLNAGNDTTICVEQTLTFNPQTNAGTNVFLWTTANTAVGAITNANTANASITPTDTASYHLHAEWGACSREDDIIVNVLHKPVPNAGKDTAICNISYAILRGSASNLSGTVNYSWSPAANIENPDQPVTREFPPGNNTTYTYTLTVTDNYGCNFSVTDDVKVRVQPPVPAFAGNDTTVVKGVPHQLFGSGGTEYLWSPSANLNSPFNANPLATLQNDTKFILKVTDVAGCIGYDTVFVKVYEGPTYYMPNAFTPNGDGLNDVFRPIPVGISNTQYFRIFNRYGELMFETNQWLKGWDGSYRGKQQPMGVYVWIIKGVDRNGKNVEMKGTVMLTH